MKLDKKVLYVAAAAGLCGLAGNRVQGAVLAQYTFPTTTTTESGSGLNPTTVLENMTATAVSDVALTTTNVETTTPAYPNPPVLRVDPDGNASNAAAAIANGTYFSFAVAPVAGETMSLSSLTFDTARGGASTARGYVVLSSADNFVSTLKTADILTARPTWTPVTVDLSAAEFQNRSTGVEFRIFTYSPANGSTVEYDNITVSGAVTPEPGSMGVMLLSGAAMLLRRRR